MKEFTVKKLFEDNKKELALSLIGDEAGLSNIIDNPHINRPGLAMAGFTARFAYDRLQILGETEVSYLQTFSQDQLYEKIRELFQFSIPCFIVAKGLSLPFSMIHLADEMQIVLISSRLSTDRLFHKLDIYLRREFAPENNMQGTLVDVYGVGMFITGKSGIGKSELALDLIERDHRFVGDDWIKIVQIDDKLIGTAKDNAGMFKPRFNLELRGIGSIDIEALFGSKSVSRNKQVDIQVELINLKGSVDKEPMLHTINYVNILNVNLPIIYLPISPGKNVSVLIEVIARNFIHRTLGDVTNDEQTALGRQPHDFDRL